MRRISELWYQALYAGTEEVRDDDLKLGVTKGINQLCLVICIINCIAGPLYALVTQKISVLFGSLVEIILVAGVVTLNAVNKRNLANISFYAILLAATFYFSVILGKMSEAKMMIVVMIQLAYFLFKSKKMRIRCISFTILVFILMVVNYKFHLFITAQAPPVVTYIMGWTAYAVIAFLSTLLFHVFDKNHDKLLTKQKAHNKIVQCDLEEQTLISLKKSNFIRMAFHEVRSQFKGMKMMLSVLSNNKQILAIEGIPQLLGHLKHANEVVEMTLTNVLSYSKGEAGIIEKPFYESINLKAILRGLADTHQYDANNKKVKIEYKVSKEIPEYIISDRFKTYHIVSNLLNNAIKFTKPDSQIDFRFEVHNNYWKLSIQDQGIGISKEKLTTIFDPFVTEKDKNNIEGTGLGLHNVKILLSALNGRIEVESRLEMGSTFAVYLPIIPNATLNGTQLN